MLRFWYKDFACEIICFNKVNLAYTYSQFSKFNVICKNKIYLYKYKKDFQFSINSFYSYSD